MIFGYTQKCIRRELKCGKLYSYFFYVYVFNRVLGVIKKKNIYLKNLSTRKK